MPLPPPSPPAFTRTIALPSQEATERLASALARVLLPGDVVSLGGDLGAGKTTLARAVIRALTADPDEEVPSPTFTLVQTYDTPSGAVWHFDLYRLCCPDEMLELGWDEAIGTAIVLVEWPDRLGPLAPADRLELTLAVTGPSSRTAVLTYGKHWYNRCESLPA